jgi:hypothetical protein
MAGFWEITLGGLLGSGIATTIVGALLTSRIEGIKQAVAEEFDRRAGRREYQQLALYELFGPVKMQLIRTSRAFRRWNGRDDFLEGQVVRSGNLAIRDLLLAKGHLIPADMLDHAAVLIEHYDAWLEKFDALRVQHQGTGAEATYVFVGPDGYPFPHAAEQAFLARAAALQHELFDIGTGEGPGGGSGAADAPPGVAHQSSG